MLAVWRRNANKIKPHKVNPIALIRSWPRRARNRVVSRNWSETPTGGATRPGPNKDWERSRMSVLRSRERACSLLLWPFLSVFFSTRWYAWPMFLAAFSPEGTYSRQSHIWDSLCIDLRASATLKKTLDLPERFAYHAAYARLSSSSMTRTYSRRCWPSRTLDTDTNSAHGQSPLHKGELRVRFFVESLKTEGTNVPGHARTGKAQSVAVTM